MSVGGAQGEVLADIADLKRPTGFEIDGSGDVILNVADTFLLRVSSKVLSMASRPFAAMFKPNFMEGQDLNVQDPPLVAMPADDAVSMLWICDNLHYKVYEGEEISIAIMLNIAVTAEKYDLVDALAAKMKESARPLLSNDVRESHDLFCLLTVAYIIRDSTLFYDVSRAIILRCRWNPVSEFLFNAPHHISDRLPAAVYVTITEINLETRNDFFLEVEHKISSAHAKLFWDSSKRLMWKYFSLDEPCPGPLDLERILYEWKLDKPALGDGEGMLDSLRKDADDFLTNWSKEHKSPGVRSKEELIDDVAAASFAIDLVRMVDRRYEGIKGICLDCMSPAYGDQGFLRCDLHMYYFP